MRLSLRHRVFLGLLGLGTLPLAAALIVVTVQVRSGDATRATRTAFDDIAESGRALLAVVDTAELSAGVRNALEAHAGTLADRTAMARRADVVSRVAAGAAGLIALAVAAAVVSMSIILARRWSAYVSAPIEELTAWVRRVEQGETLPEHRDGRGAPEFDALWRALREMSAALEKIRRQEIEQGRAHAFRETARQVAHEMRGPLTSMRLAIAQLSEVAATSGGKVEVAVDVLQDETRRLQQLATEFSDFGRLPEGPEAPVDVSELLDSVLGSTVPDTCPVRSEIQPGLTVRGHFEPLRRAIQNLLRNAVEVSESAGIEIRASLEVEGLTRAIRIEVADHGPGVPSAIRDRVFEPYFTTKAMGTGLGLAIVKQTVGAHGGCVSITDGEAGGACFIVTLPEQA